MEYNSFLLSWVLKFEQGMQTTEVMDVFAAINSWLVL